MSITEIATSVVAAVTFITLAIGAVPMLRLNRAGIAVIGAGALLALNVLTLQQAAQTVDPNTILLLMSMMMINAVLELGGFFNWAGQLVIERAGSPLILLVLVVVMGGLLSALFLNDPVVLMLTPLVCGITLRLRRNPIPYLIALACAANVGSTATITGNPQNILIGASSGIPYLTFLLHLGPIAIVGLGIVVLVIRMLYPTEFRARYFDLTKDEADLPHIGTGKVDAVMSMTTAAGLVYTPVIRKSMIVIALMLIGFFAGMPVPLAAFFAACALLVTRRIKSQKILMLVDWPLLVMFSGLFVVTGTLDGEHAASQERP